MSQWGCGITEKFVTMNPSTSRSSGDCESGWTLALEQWQEEIHENCTHTRSGRAKNEEEGEEDLSMVSDASSGPPFYEVEEDLNNENECSSFSARSRKLGPGGGRKNREKAKEHAREEQQHSCYEDTATSISMGLTKKKYSPMDNDGAKAKGKSGSEKHYSEKAASEKKGGLQGRRLW